MLLSLTLCSPPAIATPDVGEQICAPIPPVPPRLELTQLDASEDRMWGADGRYLLSTGDIGMVSLVIDGAGSGEAYLAINGDIVAHAAVHLDPATAQPVTTPWWPEQVDYSPELIAELMRVDLSAVVADSIPQEFKCSPWGRKVMKAGKYMMIGLIGASGAACCIASKGVACVVCGAGTAIGIEGVSEFADGYCE